MVDVSVGYEYRDRSEVVASEEFADSLRIGWGVDNNSWSAGFGCNHVRVGLEVPQRRSVEQYGHRTSL
jgi:hypothetical protein